MLNVPDAFISTDVTGFVLSFSFVSFVGDIARYT